jgi:hypothetical protein
MFVHGCKPGSEAFAGVESRGRAMTTTLTGPVRLEAAAAASGRRLRATFPGSADGEPEFLCAQYVFWT